MFGEIASISIPPRGCWVRDGRNTPWDGSVIERGVKGRDEGGGVEGEGCRGGMRGEVGGRDEVRGDGRGDGRADGRGEGRGEGRDEGRGEG